METEVIAAFIQARNGSTRLKKKASLYILGKPVLEHVISRVKRSKLTDKVFVATTKNSGDDDVVRICKKNGVKVFRGSSEDVLDRFYRLAMKVKPKHIVRITADCPLMDCEVIDRVIKKHIDTGADYTSNTTYPTFPDGLDVEVFRFSALKTAWQNASLQSEREHVTPYIRNNSEIFKITHLKNKKGLSNFRWTLDEPRDLEFIKKVYRELYGSSQYFGMRDILTLLKKKPYLQKINSKIKRNEGLKKSLLNDKIVKEKKLKIHFFTEAGKSAGYGHLSRCHELFKTFKSQGHACHMFINGDKTVLSMLSAGSFTLCNWLKRETPHCDIAVIDSYLAKKSDCLRIVSKSRLGVYFDDDNRIPYPPGIVINGTICAGNIKYPKDNDKQYLLGPKYQIIRKEFSSVKARKKISFKSVLITFGGSDIKNLTPKVLKVLNGKFPNLKKNVIVGASYSNLKEIQKDVDKNTKIFHSPSVRKLVGLMANSGFAICAGGQTLFELAAAGTPALVIGIAKNQKWNIKGWQKLGLVDFIGWYDDANLERKIAREIVTISKASGIKKRTRKLKNLISEKAASDILRKIKSCLKV
jgi:spore coat polysaccharide biosynthesis protein SpsF